MPDAGGTDDTAKKQQLSSKGKTVQTTVLLLDGSLLDIYPERKAKGEDVLDAVCQSLNLAEKDYFGLCYDDKQTEGNTWLELDKRVAKFMKSEPWKFSFQVKFFPPDPSQLQEDITRYYLCLQVRNDILGGKLPCSFVTYALLGSYLVQSELGDYDGAEHRDSTYLKEFRFAPDSEQTPELEQKVIELHKTHKGQTPADAELHYLENAKKLSLYGVDLHPAKDSSNVDIMVGVCASGLLIYRDRLRMNRFAWPKILKISYRRNNFFVKLRPGEFEQYESTITFKLATHKATKKLWKTCVENHTFFRLKTQEPSNRVGIMPKLSSKFRYSGKTHYESKHQTIDRQQPEFIRSHSTRKLASTSMEPIRAKKMVEEEGTKRHTMPVPPDHIPGVDSPAKKRLKDKIGANSSVSSVSSTEGEYEPASHTEDLQKPPGGVAVLPVAKKSKVKEPVKAHDTNGLPNEREDEVFNDETKENFDVSNRSFIDKETGKGREESKEGEGAGGEKIEESPDKLSKLKSPTSGIFPWGKSTKEDKASKEKDKKTKKREPIAVAVAVEEGVHEDKKKKSSSLFWGKKKDDNKQKDEGKTFKEREKSLTRSQSPDTSGKEEEVREDDSRKSKDKEGEVLGKDVDKHKTKDKKGKDKEKKSKEKKDKEAMKERDKETLKVKDKDSAKAKDKEKSKEGKSKEKEKKDKEKKEKDDSKKDKSSKKDKKEKESKKDRSKDKGKVNEGLAVSEGNQDSLVSDKDRSMESTLADEAPGFTKKYDYVEIEEEKKKKLVGAFSYEGKTLDERGIEKPVSPGRIQTGVAFNYAPGEDKRVVDAVERRKFVASSPGTDASMNISGSTIGSRTEDSRASSGPNDSSHFHNNYTKTSSTPLTSKEQLEISDPSYQKLTSPNNSSMFTSSYIRDDSFTSDSYSPNERKTSPMTSFGKSPLDESVQQSGYSYRSNSSNPTNHPHTVESTARFIEAESASPYAPKIVKTTTKQSMVKEGTELTQNIEEKIENLTSGEVTVNTQHNKAEGLDSDGASPYVTATSVTTRTATTHEDLETNAKTSQVEEKTVARSTTTSANRQEQRVVTQEVRATTSTLLNDKQVLGRRDSITSESSDDSGTPIDPTDSPFTTFQDPIVETEPSLYKGGDTTEVQATCNVPLVETQVLAPYYAASTEIVTSQTITSKTRTVETTTYKTEKDGLVETRVEQKITIQSDGDPIDHDKALAEAIQEATAMNPDMTVEKIEIQQQQQ